MTTQLAFPTDPLDDVLRPAEREAVEAKVQHDDAERGRYATPAPRCRCRRPWGSVEDAICCRCGRSVRP